MKPNAHSLYIFIYGIIAAVIAVVIGLSSSLLNFLMPFIIFIALFAVMGVVHLAFLLKVREKTYSRQMLILTRALSELRQQVMVAMENLENRDNHVPAYQPQQTQHRKNNSSHHTSDKTISSADEDDDQDDDDDDYEDNDDNDDINDDYEDDGVYENEEKEDEEDEPSKEVVKLRNLINQIYSGQKRQPNSRNKQEQTPPPLQKPNSKRTANMKNQAHSRVSMPQPHQSARPSSSRQKHNDMGQLSDDDILAVIEESVQQQNIQLYSQPIVGLPSRNTHHNEIFTRLYDKDGFEYSPARYLSIAQREGYMPAIDQLMLHELLQNHIFKDKERNRTAFFCNLSAETFNDPTFFKHFLEKLEDNPEATPSIIMEAAEANLLAGDPDLVQAIKRLKGVGFKLSLDQVSRIDEALEIADRLGFSFIKLRPSMLLRYVEGNGGVKMIHHWRDNGLELIAERMDSEVTLNELMQYDIRLSQGYLFGPPSPLETN